MDPSHDEINPEWWAGAFDAADLTEFDPPPRLSLEFNRLLQAPDIGGLQHDVLKVLAAVTSSMLRPDDWLHPFSPMMEIGNRRSVLPSDITDEQLALLARLAPLIQQPALKARVADVAWFYGDRSNVALLDIAIDAYRSAPLTEAVWFADGEDAWKRAFELVKRRGPDGQNRMDEMTEALKAQVFAASIADRFLVADWAGLLRHNTRRDLATAKFIAEHLVTLAADQEADPRLSRHLEREAAAWFGSSESAALNGCIERAARTYIAEADSRVAADQTAGALVEGLFLEKAIGIFKTLPRGYREEHGIEDLVADLRKRLISSREAALEAMMHIESDPVDLTDAVAYARSQVSGKSSPWEALAMFATLVKPMDAESTRESAERLVAGSISHIFGSSTYSRDGRKVAESQASSCEEGDPAVWAEMIRTVSSHAHLVATGLVLPAQQVLTFEHMYSRGFLVRVCHESPVVPQGHVGLWAAGLTLGLSSDYGPAVALLVPQLEHAVRIMLKDRGAHTLLVDGKGVENEKGLTALLDMPEAVEILGAGMVMELKALLVEHGAANLRNDIAHGLLDDAAAWSYDAVYAWWFCLRLVIWPLWEMRKPASDTGDGEA
jgi:hypothetical protein